MGKLVGKEKTCGPKSYLQGEKRDKTKGRVLSKNSQRNQAN